jgi:hypothetical protein
VTNRFWCWLRYRHAWLIAIVPGRVFVKCGICGRESQGWRDA